MGIVSGLVAWAKTTLGPYGVWGLIGLAVTESVFSPVPPDVLLPVLAVPAEGAAPNYAYAAWLGVVTTLASVAGAAIGYWIGREFSPWTHRRFGGDKLRRVEGWYLAHGEWIVVFAALTPVPFKVFTIASGLLGMRFWPFILASLVGRGLRFVPEALLSAHVGQQAIDWLDQGGLLLLALAAVGVAVWYGYRRTQQAPGTDAAPDE